jgi:hypothetical protein
MLEYVFDGQTFNVHPSQKDNFLQKYPEAQLVGEGNLSPEEFKANVNEQAGLVKTEDPVKETAVAGSQNESSMELPSEDGSLELPKFDPANPLGLPTDVDPFSEANKKKAADLKKIEDERKKKFDGIKKYEESLLFKSMDNVLNDPERLTKYGGATNIINIYSEEGAVPGKLTREIVGEFKNNVPQLAGLTEKETFDLIKERFVSLSEDKKRQSKIENGNDYRKYLNNQIKNGNTNVSFQATYDSYEEADIASLSEEFKYEAELRRERDAVGTTFTRKNEIIAELAQIKEKKKSKKYSVTLRDGSTLQWDGDEEKYFLDDSTGKLMNPALATDTNNAKVSDITEDVQHYLRVHQGKTINVLRNGYEELALQQAGHEMEGEEIQRIKVNNDLLRNKLREAGYNPTNGIWEIPLADLSRIGSNFINRDTFLQNVSRGDGEKFADVELVYDDIEYDFSKGMPSSEQLEEERRRMTPRQYGDYVKRHFTEFLDFQKERAAYIELLHKNKSPESIERNSFLSNLNKGGKQGIRTIENTSIQDWESGNPKFYQDELLSEIGALTSSLGIKLNEEQQKSLELSFGEELTQMTGGFAPVLAGFFGLNKVQAGTTAALKAQKMFQFAKAGDKLIKTKNGWSVLNVTTKNPKRAAEIKNILKTKVDDNGMKILEMKDFTKGQAAWQNIRSAFFTMTVEELKTQAMGFDTGSGAAFAGINLGLGRLRFNTKYNQMNTLFNKIGKSGLTFPIAAEGAANLEAIIRDFEGTDNYDSWFDEHYPDLDTFGRRYLSHVILGNGLGLTHLNKRDFYTTNRLREIRKNAYTKLKQAAQRINQEKNLENFSGIRIKNELDIYEKNIKLYSEVNNYLRNNQLLEYHSSAGKAQTYINRTQEGIKKEFKENYGIDLDIKVIENNNNKDFISDKSRANFTEKGKNNFEIKLNLENLEMGVMPHELGHAGIKAIFKSNVALREQWRDKFESILGKIKLSDGRSVAEAIRAEKDIQRRFTDEELFTYTAEYLSKPEYYTQLTAQNAFYNLKLHTQGLFERTFKNYKPKLKTENDLIEFFGKYAIAVNKGKGFSKYMDMFDKLIEPTGKTTKGDKASLELESSKKTGVEKLEAKIQENRDMGPGNRILNNRIEQEFKQQIEKVKQLETEFSAFELREQIKKAKGKEKENLELALQEKFKGFETEVELAGLDIKTGDTKVVKQSKQLVQEAEINIERQILKQRTGKFEGNKILQNNIDTQYNKIAMAALGFKLKKSFDAESLGLKRAEFNDALSFVTQYKDGIIKRWDPDRNVKFSTLVYSNIQPKRALFYEQAFGKGAEVTGRITEKTKEIADTTAKTEKAPDLIDPLSFSKDAAKDIKAYEAGLKNIDLSKQDYSTLKDVAPKVTDKIFGETFEAKQEFIKNNAKQLYDLLPLAFRRMTEGTKSSTKINPGILKNFYVTGGRADMTVGTKAGLPIKVKIPWTNASKKFNELFVEKKTGNDLRNQKTLVKGLQAEIGRAITNSVARRNPKHPDNLIQKLADGKADVLASIKLSQFEAVKNEFGGLITKDAKTVQRIARSFDEIVRNIDGASFFIIASNLAPGGNSYTRMRDGSLFVSKALDKATLDAIKTNNALEVAALKKLKQELDLDIRPGTSKAPEWTIVIKSQKTKNLNKNLKEVDNFKKNFKTGLDILTEMYKVDPQATGLVVYNQNANSSSTRNMAQLRGVEIGPKKILEEHVLQHGQFSKLVGVYAQVKNGKAKQEMADWLAENYIQISLGSGTGKFATRTDSHALVDGTYTVNGVKYKSKSELHPFLAEKVQQAIDGKISWKEVPSSNIRLYNDVVKLNANKITQEGITHAKKYNVEVPKRFENEKVVYEKQADLIFQQFKGEITPAKAKAEIDLFVKNRYPKIKKGIKQVEKAQAADAKSKKNIKESKDLNTKFNEYLEASTGIGSEKVFSDAMAEARGKKVRRSFGDYFIPPGAEDFAGLLHKTLARGKKGEQQLEFYRKNLYDPYNLAMENITREQVALGNDFRALISQLTNVPKTLKQTTKGGDFTKEHAVRVAVWKKLGYEIPGLSKSAEKELLSEVKNNPELNLFASELVRITKGDGYAKPDANWVGTNIAVDMVSLINGTKRSRHLEQWQKNVDILFSKENLNKLEAAYGKNWVTNLTKTLVRMKTGSNRQFGGDKNLEQWNDWVNGSVGAIMFLNTRSAVLQTISNVNYLNFSDNNPLAAAKAFANQKQYWKDFVELYNSDYLVTRRGGTKINVNESEIALAAQKGGAQGVISMLLNKGFVLTRMADSFAIASGGAAMYRNRINKYKKEGFSEKEATEKAFLDFKRITEETQQSSRPDRISEQQAGNLGRFMLAFANTPMQYNRIIKKNVQDLLARRGDPKEKISKITYYSMIQNFIFNALQKALFVNLFSTEDEETEIARNAGVANGMIDSLLRGQGLTGNAVVAVKNIAIDVANRMDRPQPNFQDAAWKALTVSPPLYSKATKLRGVGYSLRSVTKDNIFEPKLDNPALTAAAQFSSATINLPLDRALRKARNIEAAMGDEAEYWQRVALLLGWGEWELGMQTDKKKAPTKQILDTRIQRQNTNTERLRIKRK